MKTEFETIFVRDLKSIRDKKLKTRIGSAIQSVEQAASSREITNMIKVQGANAHYRIRVGDYRIGLVIENETVIFVRCLHRSEVYDVFP